MVRCRRGRGFVSVLELLGFRSDSREPYQSGPDHHSDISKKSHHSKQLRLPNPGLAPQTIHTDPKNVPVIGYTPVPRHRNNIEHLPKDQTHLLSHPLAKPVVRGQDPVARHDKT